jgi:hypothetical protein
MRRLRRLGVSQWPRETNVVEPFCDRGNGLHAMARLGFRNIEGVDLSPRLLADYERQTYESWLARPREISQLANRYFQPELETFAWGKWNFVGRLRP